MKMLVGGFKLSFSLVVCLSFCCLPAVCNKDDNPFVDLASAFLQNAMQGEGGGGGNGLEALGGLVGTLMQNQNLGELMGQNGNAGGDMLAGLGSLLGNKDMKLDPAMIGNVISMFAQANQNQGPSRSKRNSDDDEDLDLGNILGAASSLFQNQNSQNWLPVIMNTISAFSAEKTEEKVHQHQDHAWFLPPVLEKVHVYWEQFIESDLGRTIWTGSGLDRALAHFKGADGKVDFELVLSSLENHSFRRRWIKSAAIYLSDTAVYFSDPEVLKRYASSAEYIINSFLKSQGFPKDTMFSAANAADSITKLANFIVSKYFDIGTTDMGVYVKPAMRYTQEVLAIAQKTGRSLLTGSNRQALTDKLTDTLNLEVIEPVLRVYRAYRHARAKPHCQEHLMCLVNKHDPKQDIGLPGFKKALTKISSFVASAALSYHSGRQIWDLYNAIQLDVDCQAHYPADCSEFHENEMKVTTELYHNEL